MNFFCIDDDIQFLKKIKNTCLRFSMQRNIDIDIHTTSIIPDKLPSNIDAYFLDIELSDNTTIFQFIKKIRLEDQTVPILIISNYESYVLSSVKFNIFDFIRKTHFKYEIEETLDRLILYLDKLLPIISFKHYGIEYSLKVKEIFYIETYSHYSVIHTVSNSYEIKKDTKNILKENQKFFLRIHRSFYINPFYIKKLTNNKVILINNIELPIGKKYLSSTRKKYIIIFSIDLHINNYKIK